MASLLATTACAGLLPRTIGTLTLTERTPVLTSVTPFKGKKTALRKALGGWPAPGEATGKATGKATGRTLWSAHNQVFVVGDCPDLTGLAATTDQTDAWAALTLSGADLDAVLARLTPLDTAAMAPGSTARSLLGHMSALFHRTDTGMDIYVFRSMAHTAVHELSHAMTSVTARASLKL